MSRLWFSLAGVFVILAIATFTTVTTSSTPKPAENPPPKLSIQDAPKTPPKASVRPLAVEDSSSFPLQLIQSKYRTMFEPVGANATLKQFEQHLRHNLVTLAEIDRLLDQSTPPTDSGKEAVAGLKGQIKNFTFTTHCFLDWADRKPTQAGCPAQTAQTFDTANIAFYRTTMACLKANYEGLPLPEGCPKQ